MLIGMAAEDDVLDVVRGATARRRYVTALPHVPVKVLSGVSAFPVALWSSNSFNTSALSKKSRRPKHYRVCEGVHRRGVRGRRT
jgi:hypothetical protein